MPNLFKFKSARTLLSIILVSFLLMSFVGLLVFAADVGEIDDKDKPKQDSLLKHYSENSDLYKTADGKFRQVIYPSARNIEYNGKFIPFENYLNVSNDKGRIKFENLDGDICYIELEYNLTNVLSIASPTINITRQRGSYYFTTNIGKDVDSMAYNVNCSGVSFSNNELNILDNVKVDFQMAEDLQNISTTFNEKDKKLEFKAVGGKTADLSYIDPVVNYNGSSIVKDGFIYDSGATDRYYSSFIQFNLESLEVAKGSDIIFANLSLFRGDDGASAGTDFQIYLIYNQSINILTDSVDTLLNSNQDIGYNYTVVHGNAGDKWYGFDVTNQTQTNFNVSTNTNLTFKLDDESNSDVDDVDAKNTIQAYLRVGNSYNNQEHDFWSTEWVGFEPNLEITYYDLIINEPSSNDEILNTKEDILNISTTGYNHTVWYTINEGKANITICDSPDDLDCAENETTVTFSHQGFFNLTVYANKSDGTQTSETANNLFVGNRTRVNITKDTYIVESNPTYNFGQHIVLVTGDSSNTKDRALIWANFSSIVDVTVKNLNLYTYLQSDCGTDEITRLYKLNHYWEEGTAISAVNSLSYNGTTYYERFYGNNANDGNTPFDYVDADWQSSGLGSATDYNSTAISSVTPTTTSTWHSWSMNGSDLQGWIDNSTTNYGLLIKRDSEFGDDRDSWSSSNHTTTSQVPYFNITYYSPNAPPETPTLHTPLDLSSTTNNLSVFFNWTGTDPNDDNLTYSLFFDTNVNPTTLINTSFNNSGNSVWLNWTNTSAGHGGFADGTYYWKVYAQDEFHDENITSSIFSLQISTEAPSIQLDYPPNEEWFNSILDIYFNFTAIDSDGLDTCHLYSNWTGDWHLNESFRMTSGVQNFTIKNLTEGGLYAWNTECNDTDNNVGWGLNRTMGVDLTNPLISNISITTTENSQLISFNYTSTDILSGVNSCWYSIFDSDGNIDGLNNNVSIACETTKSAIVSGFATFNLTVYLNDTAGNENSTSKSFTTASGTVLGGGGGEVIVENVTIVTCGDGVCDRERGETFYNCPDDCARAFEDLNLDSLLFNCYYGYINDDEELWNQCYWVSNTGLLYILGFIGSVFIFTIFFEIARPVVGKRRFIKLKRKRKKWWRKR